MTTSPEVCAQVEDEVSSRFPHSCPDADSVQPPVGSRGTLGVSDLSCGPRDAETSGDAPDPRTVEALDAAVAVLDRRLRELTNAIAESAWEYALATRRLV